ncbi:hypothetical protein [Pseudoalteromonas sp.]
MQQLFQTADMVVIYTAEKGLSSCRHYRKLSIVIERDNGRCY